MFDQDDTEQAMADLLREAGQAHHEAYLAADGFDPEWPLWYADYLHEKMSALLHAEFTKSELIYLLVLMDKEQRLDAPGAGWPEYYARFLADRYL